MAVISPSQFSSYVRNHIPGSMYEEVAAEHRSDALRALEVFERTPGETVDERLSTMSERAVSLNERGNALAWGAFPAFLVGALVMAGTMAIPAVAPIAAGLMTLGPTSMFLGGLAIAGRGNAQGEAANTLHEYRRRAEHDGYLMAG